MSNRCWIRIRVKATWWNRIKCLFGRNFIMYGEPVNDDWGFWVKP